MWWIMAAVAAGVSGGVGPGRREVRICITGIILMGLSFVFGVDHSCYLMVERPLGVGSLETGSCCRPRSEKMRASLRGREG